MYEYRPQFEKKKEKLLAWLLTALGVVLYVTSQLPGAPVPGFVQILAIGCLAGMIMIVSMCILRRYSYELVQNEEGKTDFIITEHYSRRKTVVCRVGLEDVVSVVPFEKKANSSAEKKEKKTVYSYTGVLFDEKRYSVEMQAHGEHFFVVICADERLLELLSNH